ncbi:MAG TPA: thioredoxin family protein, partial [Lamprocystis sp. (in: g-proteobacteria)]|nr:thioredoxin family protein [Lamprocystis sp. (in: g-proteobacteria)]
HRRRQQKVDGAGDRTEVAHRHRPSGLMALLYRDACRAAAGKSDRLLGSGQPTVIDVGARTCIPCKKMAPILEALAVTYQGKASVLFVDLHEDEETANTLRVQMIPTEIFFNAQGREVSRHIGFMDESAILAQFKTLGVRTPGVE